MLGDIVGPALTARLPRRGARAPGTPSRIPGVDAGLDVTGRATRRAPPPSGGFGDAIVVLRANYRFRGSLAELAAAVRSGDADRAIELLSIG